MRVIGTCRRDCALRSKSKWLTNLRKKKPEKRALTLDGTRNAMAMVVPCECQWQTMALLLLLLFRLLLLLLLR